MTLPIETRNEPDLFDDDRVALVFPGMAGRAVGCVTMLVEKEDAKEPFLGPSGWQTTEYRWLSDPVRNEGPDLIVPLEQSVTRLLDDFAHLRIVLLDAGIEGMTAGRAPAVSPGDDPQSAPPPLPSFLRDQRHAASPPQFPIRLVAPLVGLAIVGIGIGVWKYESPRPAAVERAGSTTHAEVAVPAQPLPPTSTPQPAPVEPRPASREPAPPAPVPVPSPASADAPVPEREPSGSLPPAPPQPAPTLSQTPAATPGSDAFLLSKGEARGTRIELTGGSVIIGDITGRTEDTYTIHTVLGETVAIPATSILTIDGRVSNPASPAVSNPVAPAVSNPVAPTVSNPVAPAVLRLTGSNTIGAKLAPALAVAYLKSKGAGDSADREIAPQESAIDTAPPVPGMPAHIEVTAHGSATAFKALGAGETDIGMASRPITQQESLDLAALGDMTKVTSEHVVALDGLAVIVHPANPVQTLTKDQLAQIFCGKTRDWAAFGGKPGPIAIYARDNKSETLDTFKNLVPGACELAGTATRFQSSEELSAAVAADPGGIGFIGLADVGRSRAVRIAECKLNYPPSSFAVKTEEYPLSHRLFLYTPNQHAAAVEDFLNYTRSDPAQRVIAESGLIDLGIELDTAETQTARKAAALSSVVRMATLTKFATTTDGATRLSVTFRFRKNGADLDNRALLDLDRLKDYLRTPAVQGRQLLLLGFSDTAGFYRTNVELSLRRAQSIAAKLGAPNVEAYGFGPEAPVACNDTADGKDKNRHVEVWLR